MFSLRETLVQFGNVLQGRLFPVLEAELGPLSDLRQQLVRTLALLQLDACVQARCGGRGRPAHDRGVIARAFVAKAVFNLQTTRALLDRLRADVVLRRRCRTRAHSRGPSPNSRRASGPSECTPC
jgi:hypothetical protein